MANHLETIHGESSPSSGARDVDGVGIRHVYSDGFEALCPLDISVAGGSFCTLLGPSGSGKTTLLRIFAGLISPTEGRVRIGGVDVTNTPVQDRRIGFVFQHYALFPHLTVGENLAFPLKLQRVPKARRAARVAELLDLVNMAGAEARMPGQLSGGQQQRIAVARALIYDPQVLLLDEPLGALDRRLRQQLGSDLRRIQRESGTTAIYVTHDQEEAFLLSDSVVVMDKGRILQEGVPEEVYRRPNNAFVARFLGDTNVLKAEVTRIVDAGLILAVGGRTFFCSTVREVPVGDEVEFSIRPEELELARPGQSTATPDATSYFGDFVVEDQTFMGGRFRVRVRSEDVSLVAEVPASVGHVLPGDLVAVSWSRTAPVLL